MPTHNKFGLLPDEQINTLDDNESQNKRPLVMGRYNRYHIIVFFDTGAPTNLMSVQTYEAYFAHLPLIQDEESLSLYDIQGGSLNVKGIVKLEFEMAGVPIVEDIIVVNNIQLAGHILFGFPAIVRNQIIIDPTRDGIHIEDRFLEFYKPVSFWVYDVNSSKVESNNVKTQSEKKEGKLLMKIGYESP